MEYTSLILVHIAAGVLWAGGSITAGFFVIPAALDAGPGGGAVMAGVMKRGFPKFMTLLGILVVLSGLRLYMLRFNVAWLGTPGGVATTLGGLLALGAFFLGLLVQKPAAERLGQLSGELAAAGAPPTPEQAAGLAQARARLGKIGRVTAWHLVAATVLMASRRLLEGL